MRIVIAPDSFKESLSAADVAAALADGVRAVLPDAELIIRPMADGGEGTVDALLSAHPDGERRRAYVSGPLGVRVDAEWGWLPASRTAVIESAAAAGLHHVPREQRDVMRASSAGVGELMMAALDAGATRIIVGLGGSATNDGGLGLLRALGIRFLDHRHEPVSDGAAGLLELMHVDASAIDPRLTAVRVDVANDVDSPLCGPLGASHLFGPQKGGTADQLARLDAALDRYATLCTQVLARDERDAPGAGAAGGMGYALKTFLHASFHPGAELVAGAVGLAEQLRGADLVLTGEGRLDAQTLRGKTPMGVARYAREACVPVIAFGGSLGEAYEALYGAGIHAAFSIAPGPITLESAMTRAAELLRQRCGDVIRVWMLGRR